MKIILEGIVVAGALSLAFFFILPSFIMGIPVLEKSLYVFYWIGTLVLSFLITKIRFSVTKSGNDWSRKKKFFLLFMIFNIPPAAVPVFTFVQWGTMCLTQEDYVVHSTFDTPADFLDGNGFPSFVSDYRGDFRLPMEKLDLEVVDNSSRINDSIYRKNILIQKTKSKDPVFEYSVLTFGASGFPNISYIYRETGPLRCGYNSGARTKRKYKNIMKKIFINKDVYQ